jgi:hypothetical protein
MMNLRNELKTITESPIANDNRRYSTSFIVGCLMTMSLCRIGSFNAVETSRGKKIWSRLMGRKALLCNADTLGRRAATINAESIRTLMLRSNRQMRRRKTFRPLRMRGYAAIVVDGHEIGRSYRRDFGDSTCLQREIPQKDGSPRTQYYQRLVNAVLVCDGHTQLLDIEMQLPGEDEIAAALRLLERVGINYGSLFDLVLADGLYAQAPFFKAVRKMGKHVIAVLKHERRDLTKDVRQLLPVVKQQFFCRGDNNRITVAAWDIEGLTSRPQTGQPVRVVRTEETRKILRQAHRKKNSNFASLRRLLLSGCGLQLFPVKLFQLRILSILPTIAGILKMTVSMNWQQSGMLITFTNMILMQYRLFGF